MPASYSPDRDFDPLKLLSPNSLEHRERLPYIVKPTYEGEVLVSLWANLLAHCIILPKDFVDDVILS
jgi:hypothetical protein